MSAYLIFSLSSIAVFVALAALLHLQFGRAGIVNFGVVGFVGLGMYTFGALQVQYDWPYFAAMVVGILAAGVAGLLLGGVILKLDDEAVLVSTLAFATIVAHLVTTEKWLTNGVVGLGTLRYPFDVGSDTPRVFLGLTVLLAAAIMFYAYRLQSTPYGRLMLSIRDNEPLAKSLGKRTFREKLIFFTISSAVMGLIGVMYGTMNQFLVPRMVGPGLTFVVWIALILGGKTRVMGALVGVLLTAGLFDIVIESYVPIPKGWSNYIPDLKLMLYGLTLVLVIMFRPRGVLGERGAR
ncbi:MAG: branched-chain amino acid ABC transporter permease [Acidimicrobiia bacterium]